MLRSKDRSIVTCVGEFRNHVLHETGQPGRKRYRRLKNARVRAAITYLNIYIYVNIEIDCFKKVTKIQRKFSNPVLHLSYNLCTSSWYYEHIKRRGFA